MLKLQFTKLCQLVFTISATAASSKRVTRSLLETLAIERNSYLAE